MKTAQRESRRRCAGDARRDERRCRQRGADFGNRDKVERGSFDFGSDVSRRWMALGFQILPVAGPIAEHDGSWRRITHDLVRSHDHAQDTWRDGPSARRTEDAAYGVADDRPQQERKLHRPLAVLVQVPIVAWRRRDRRRRIDGPE